MPFGKIKYWLLERGYGFIRADDGAEYFAHIRHVKTNDDWLDDLPKGTRVSFEIGDGCEPGSVQAVNIHIVEEGNMK